MARHALWLLFFCLVVVTFSFRWDEEKPDIDAFLGMTRNAAIDADIREKSILELGRRGGPDAVRKLMALGNEDTYFNFAAVNALGAIQGPEVARYLEEKCFHADPRMVAAAVSSLAQIEGAAAVPPIAVVLERNRHRDDGHQDWVCSACVKALGDLAVPSAWSVLALELEKTVGVTLHYEYGSKVVAALGEIGNPACREALSAYMERLQAAKGKHFGNPKGEHYFQSKIDEVGGVLSRLRSCQSP
jgi:HEAT repeat protein